MPSLDYFRSLFRHDDWANRASWQSLLAVTNSPPRATEVMAHIAGAELLWLERLLETPQTAVVWPTDALRAVGDQLTTLHRRWMRYLASLGEDDLKGEIDYVNSQGEPWRNNRRDILMHVILHSSYHRGQIASLLGRAGHQSAYTDFIHGVRQQLF